MGMALNLESAGYSRHIKICLQFGVLERWHLGPVY